MKDENFDTKELKEETITYTIDSRYFIIEPVYKKDSLNTLEVILMRLITTDSEVI